MLSPGPARRWLDTYVLCLLPVAGPVDPLHALARHDAMTLATVDTWKVSTPVEETGRWVDARYILPGTS